MRKGWAAVILQRTKQRIGIDLIARASQVAAAIIAAEIVSIGCDRATVVKDVFAQCPGIPNAIGGDGSDIGAFEFGAFAIRGDFNSDGFTDYLLFNSGSRATAIWYLDDNTYVSGRYGPTLPVGWTATDVADFNGIASQIMRCSTPARAKRRSGIWTTMCLSAAPTVPPLPPATCYQGLLILTVMGTRIICFTIPPLAGQRSGI